MKKLWQIFIIFFLVFAARASYGEQDKSEFNQWQYKINAEERFRHEYKKDFDLNKSAKDNGSQLYHRLRLGVNASLTDEYLKPKLDIFVEGLDAQTGGYQTKAVSAQVDDFDLHQAYFNVFNILGSDFDIKIGRQEIKYGKSRLIDAPTWSNRIRSFDAAVIHYHKQALSVDALYAQDVKFDDNNFNRSLDEENLSGLYANYQKDKKSPLWEGYFLTQIISSTDALTRRYTTGLRWQGALPNNTLLDIEIPYQFGETGTKDIRAYAFHADISKEFSQTFWKPKASFSYDEASGDKDPNDSVSNTFVPLYQSTHSPYGLMDLFRWQNIRNPEVSVVLSPTEKLRFTPQVDLFWLQSKYDSWVNSSGTVIRSKTGGDRNYFVGTEWSLRANYDLSKNIKLEAGYAHFSPGGYAKDTGADDSADWFYSQIAYKF
ncbi:MAG: alginate export family protein [Candidatus Omnitrophota bacterium]